MSVDRSRRSARSSLLGGGSVFVLAAGFGVIGSAPVAANCSSTGSNAYTCSGNFSQGVNVASQVNRTSAQEITFDGLTADIAPTGTSGSAQGIGILWQTGIQPTWLNLADPTYRIVVDAATHSSLVGKAAVALTGFNFSNSNFQGGVELSVGMPVTAISTGQPAVLVATQGAADASIGPVNVYGTAAVTSNNASEAVFINLLGGTGSNGSNSDGEGGSSGGNGGAVSVSHDASSSTTGSWTLSTTGSNATALRISTIGGKAGSGGNNSIGTGGGSGDGGAGGTILVGGGTVAAPGPPARLMLSTAGSNSAALFAFSRGGDSNSGGNGGLGGGGGNSEPGGLGGKIVLNLDSSSIMTNGSASAGILSVSQGGNGGKGGAAGTGTAGHGGVGRGGGDIDIIVSGASTVTTRQSDSDGIAGYSIGGTGGEGGDGNFLGPGGAGGTTGNSGDVTIDTSAAGAAQIKTFGDGSYGIVAQSIAGHGGATGTSGGLVEFSAQAASAGRGGNITIRNAAGVTTTGNVAIGLSAQSIGGGGGHGGDSFGLFYAKGGTGGQGGNGSTVLVDNAGSVTTTGNSSAGISAQSIGGSGGAGGSSGGLFAIGGAGGVASTGGAVTVTSSGVIMTGFGTPSGDVDADDGCTEGCSPGILAQSIGGGGGTAGSSGGWFAFGGTGGGGGGGGGVTVDHSVAMITTTQLQSPGIHAQSIGGGGGNGGGAGAGGDELSAAVGGQGGDGGSAGAVDVDFFDGATIETDGDFSYGVAAQSIGGGGGSGGFSVDAAIGAPAPAMSLAVGGAAGGGGGGGTVTVNTTGPNGTSASGQITTRGDNATGIFAQSVGGGGGHGGLAVAVGVSDVTSLAIGVGGSGGSGGKGSQVTVTNNAGISTSGDHADGLLAQSVGGGGGHGGTSVAVSISTAAALAVGVGGSGGSGGIGNPVHVTSRGALPISTSGDFSLGVLAQAVGGGGGKGGTAISGSLTLAGEDGGAALALGFGGSGGAGGQALEVTADIASPVSTSGDHAAGITAQSVAGGGGAGGNAVSATVSTSNSYGIGFSLGGSGGAGANAGGAEVTSGGGVSTGGDHSPGLVAQSIAGGGGSGGLALSGSLTLSSAKALDIAIGGQGGKGGGSKPASAHLTGGDVMTNGQFSDGIVAQSIGGGGGNGGAAVTGSVTTSDSVSIGLALGGGCLPTNENDCLSGGTAGTTTVTTTGDVTVTGDGSRGVVAQSIGGGGGAGGAAISGSLTTSSSSKDLTVSVGGLGGSGGSGGVVNVTTSGLVSTGSSDEAVDGLTGEHGVLAQSIGGGGGAGGLAANGTANSGNRSLQVSVGGFGGSGATASDVDVTNEGGIGTLGSQSHGILAQSIGGGGGDGGGTTTFGATTKSSKAYSVSVGGLGGGGARTGVVTVTNEASITAAGVGSRGIVAQSIAGGGGTGGANLFKNQSGSNDPDQFSLGVGGFGGTGAGASGVALATSAASAITTGATDGSQTTLLLGSANLSGTGVLLQSIGGGGGAGSAGIQGDVKPNSGGDDNGKSADIAVGGFGGGGGGGGAVTAGTTSDPLLGTVTTWNFNSDGIVAQSIGGGGGAGGAGIDGDVSNGSSKGFTIGVGGFGGGSGAGNTVGVQSAATVTVHGDNSRGILAQSIGGGGGAGGTGIKGNVSGSSDDDTEQLAVALGGLGGSGVDGGAVTIGNSGTITAGDLGSGSSTVMGMDALAAQSIGGGGGASGTGIEGDISNSTKSKAITLTIGASLPAGGAGNGKTVTVINSGTLSASGNASRGIFAQSIGGGGGAGGVGIDGDVTVPPDASSDTQLALGVGGIGGTAGAGGQVTVTNTGKITTAFTTAGSNSDQQGMHGIFAQSVGGGGGAGGIAIDGDVTGSENSDTLDVAVGGFGGAGGDADTVTVVNAGGAITTGGDGSRGIFAQSVGGGGGDASGLLNGTVSSGKGTALTVAVGASGGKGGKGGAVSVTNSGGITTGARRNSSLPTVNQAHGILAQSVGGGGGTGKLSGGILYGSSKNIGFQPGLSMSLGSPASAGAGEDVTVINQRGGAITTWNFHSHGIFAQSVGGGGGHAADVGGIGTQDPSDRWLVDLNVGGGAATSGTSGDGGDARVRNSDAITTNAAGSMGIYVQSVGGGGGAAGDGAGVKQQVENVAQSTFNAVISANLGGQSTSNGDGGMVQVTNTGAISTSGEAAVGIYGQSVGGGGGRVAGAAASSVAGQRSGIITIGGTGGTTGDGGSVTVTTLGDITTGKTSGGGAANASTSVIQAHGVFAQSVGGGGGDSGTVLFGPESSFGSGLTMSRAGDKDTSGVGGDVAVSSSGTVTTQGNSSVGIFAQSVGGGGGVRGEVNTTLTGALIGSGGGEGEAGVVTVVYAGSGLATSGDAAHGIFAQSAGGAKSSTSDDVKVSVTAAGDVTASGGGAHGIYAQSSGDGMGAIAVTVEPGATVSGGGAAAIDGAAAGAGIFVQGGTSDSTITNQGTITSTLGADGVAINVIDADVQIVNSGTITGHVLKASSIDFRNRPGGVVNAGAELQTDRFANHGLLTIGPGRIDATALSGRLLQGATGVTAFDLDPSRPPEAARADGLTITGAASLAGQIRINVVDPWQPEETRQAVDLIETEGALTSDDLTVIPSAVAQYRLRRPGDGTIGGSYDIDFRNPGILPATNDNQDDVARHVHGTYRARALDDGVALALIRIEDRGDYRRVMNTLGAEVALDNQIVSLLSSLRFGDALLSCAERTGTYRYFDEGRCGWLQLGGSRFERDGGDDSTGFDANVWQVAGGLQTDLDDWSLGAAISYETVDLDVTDSYASSDGHLVQAGASAKRRFSATEISASLALGYGDFDIDRDPLPGISISGQQRQWAVSGQLRAAHLIERGAWSFKPRIDLGLDYLSMDGFKEADGSLGVEISDSSETYFHVQPAIDIGTELETRGVLYRPKLTLGVTQFLGDNAPSVDGRLVGAPKSVDSFTASTDLDRTRLDVAASLDVFARDNMVIRGGVATSVARDSRSYGANLRIEISF